jgi:hypothetical protein
LDDYDTRTRSLGDALAQVGRTAIGIDDGTSDDVPARCSRGSGVSLIASRVRWLAVRYDRRPAVPFMDRRRVMQRAAFFAATASVGDVLRTTG